MWTDTDVSRRLKLKAPIVQGPFGGGLSAVDLAATVSEAGGLGSFGVHHLSGTQIKATATALRAKTAKPFALNLWIPYQQSDDPPLSDAEFQRSVQTLAPYFKELNVPPPARPVRFSPRYDEQVEALLATRPAAFSFVFGIPEPAILQRCRELDIVTLGAATTPDEAVLLDQAGVDMIVATGFEAGGHRVSFVRPAEESLTGTFALIPQVVDAVKAPVIAAGGIADGRGVAAAMMLGAQGAQIGTAFLACNESAASNVQRDKLFSSDARYTALTRAFSGRLARGIRNRFMNELASHSATLPPYPVQNWLTGQLKPAAIAQNRPDLMSLWSGQSAPLLRQREAAALYASLVEETSRALRRFRGD